MEIYLKKIRKNKKKKLGYGVAYICSWYYIIDTN